jgi:LysM repeat protein
MKRELEEKTDSLNRIREEINLLNSQIATKSNLLKSAEIELNEIKNEVDKLKNKNKNWKIRNSATLSLFLCFIFFNLFSNRLNFLSNKNKEINSLNAMNMDKTTNMKTKVKMPNDVFKNSSKLTQDTTKQSELNFVYYTVKSGDTIFKIAEKYNVKPEIITNINNIKNADLVDVGFILKIPLPKTVRN